MATIGNNDLENQTEAYVRLKWVDKDTILARAAAKVNLTLAVGAERPDGYHIFESLMATVTLCDRMVITRADRGIKITCNDPAVPVDSRNLVYRAASLLAWYGKVSPAIEIDLDKRIPTASGLGGGSSDAAACLIGLNTLWHLDLPVTKLSEIAAVLGSDVGFFLSGPLALCQGRGEQVHPLGCRWDFLAVIVKGSGHLSTDQVYRYHRVSDPNCFGLADDLANSLATNKPSELSSRFRNDLEPAAFRANGTLSNLRAELETCAAVPVRMSGSGTAMFATFDTRDQAGHFAEHIDRSYPELAWWLVKNNPW